MAAATPEPEPQEGRTLPEGATPEQASKASRTVSGMVTQALKRLGSGMPEELRDQITGKARLDKFTERAKKVLVLAQLEAHRMNHNYIGTEHLLLGLAAEGKGIAGQALQTLEVGLPEIRRGVEFVVGRGDKPVDTSKLSLTPRAKKVIELAVQEARSLNHNYVGTEHLLLGLSTEGEGVAAGILESMGAPQDRVRGAVMATLGPAGTSGSAGPAKDNVVTCRIASDDLIAIDMLVEAGIRSTRSDAAQWLIHAGITANKSLFDEVADTVAQIRRLRDQAREAAQRLSGTGENGGEE